MSEIAFRPRGGQEGVSVTKNEMSGFADFMKSEYLDQFIPLPNVKRESQKERTASCLHGASPLYWETETGSHGWCCSHCGTVVQWG